MAMMYFWISVPSTSAQLPVDEAHEVPLKLGVFVP